jgi:hypothetical protein
MTPLSIWARCLAVLAVGCAASGCAAVFKGSTQDVRFDALPPGADVRVDGQYVGAAPAQAELRRADSVTVTVSKPGYADQSIRVQHHPDAPWFVWDIATCVVPVLLCIPVLVDAISGSWYSLEDEYRVKLDPAAPAAAPAPTVIVPLPPPSATAPEGAGY